MDVFDSLFMLATAYALGASALVWGVTESIKRALFHDDELKDRYLPFVAFGVSFVISLAAWGWAGDFRLASLVPYLIGSLLILAGGEGIHSKVKKLK